MDGSGKVHEPQKGGRRGSGIVEIAILFILPLLLHYLIPIRIVIPPPYSYLGAIVMLLGFWLMIWAASIFRKSGTGFQLEEGCSTLVTSGPFRFSRNPMYLGILTWLIGFAVLLGSLVVFYDTCFHLSACRIHAHSYRRKEDGAEIR
jgi:protein-S-isoprenylcysteine O-methyltransferase Ste14